MIQIMSLQSSNLFFRRISWSLWPTWLLAPINKRSRLRSSRLSLAQRIEGRAMKKVATTWSRERDQIEHHCGNLIPLADPMCILLAKPDAETAIDGMHKVMLTIADHARSIRDINTAEPSAARRGIFDRE
jgi:hypothetical protein